MFVFFFSSNFSDEILFFIVSFIEMVDFHTFDQQNGDFFTFSLTKHRISPTKKLNSETEISWFWKKQIIYRMCSFSMLIIFWSESWMGFSCKRKPLFLYTNKKEFAHDMTPKSFNNKVNATPLDALLIKGGWVANLVNKIENYINYN